MVRRVKRTGPSAVTVVKVRRRDGGHCVLCAETYGLQTHHRRPRGLGGSSWSGINLPSNLLTLCRMHHDYIESHRQWALDNGLLVRQSKDPARIPVTLSIGRVYLTADGEYRKPGEPEGNDD